MTKRRLLSSVIAAATTVGACLFLAPTAQAADECHWNGKTLVCTGTSNGQTVTATCNFSSSFFPCSFKF